MKEIKTKDVLKMIGISSIVIGAVLLPGLPQALVKVHKAWKDVNKKDLGRIIKRLEKQEMISIKDTAQGITIEITEKGKHRILEYDFEKIQLKSIKRDGNWRLIIFDIPEYKKSAREIFRRKLNELEFTRVQDSVYASAFPCKDEIDFLCNFLGISDFVTVVVLKKFERGEGLIFKKYNT